MELTPTADVRSLLALRLLETGDLRTEAWRRTVERVPREVFVPRYFERAEETGGFELVDGGRPEHRDRWLAAVYDLRQSLVIDVEWVEAADLQVGSQIGEKLLLAAHCGDVVGGLTVHSRCARPTVPPDPCPRHRERRRVSDKVEQVGEPSSGSSVAHRCGLA